MVNLLRVHGLDVMEKQAWRDYSRFDIAQKYRQLRISALPRLDYLESAPAAGESRLLHPSIRITPRRSS
jgi:hypothetical protein